VSLRSLLAGGCVNRVGGSDTGHFARGAVADEFWCCFHPNPVHCLSGIPRTSQDLLRRSLASVRHLYVRSRCLTCATAFSVLILNRCSLLLGLQTHTPAPQLWHYCISSPFRTDIGHCFTGMPAWYLNHIHGPT